MPLTSNDQYVLEIMQEHGLVSDAQIEEAQGSIMQAGTSTVEVLIDRDVLDEDEVMQVLAEQFGMQKLSMKDVDVPVEVRDMLDTATARRYRVVPVFMSDNVLTVALSDPLKFDTLDGLRHTLQCDVEAAVTTRDELKVALDQYYTT